MGVPFFLCFFCVASDLGISCLKMSLLQDGALGINGLVKLILFDICWGQFDPFIP